MMLLRAKEDIVPQGAWLPLQEWSVRTMEGSWSLVLEEIGGWGDCI